MNRDLQNKFYQSKRWRQTKDAYISYRRGLCERCLAKGVYKPGEIVHHKKHITAETIMDPAVTLNFDNLELVCRDCHAELHSNKEGARFTFDEKGRVIFS